MTHHADLTQADLLSLKDETFVGGVTHFDETDSTNSQALALASSGAVEGMPHLVYAESQLNGRGRGSNQWWSAHGSLTFSLVVDFESLGLTDRQRPLLPLVTGMAILQTGKAYLTTGDFALKWPNDVYLTGRKLAGILIEVPATPPNFAVIGVGLNVNNRFGDATPALRQTGVSLSDFGHPQDRRKVLRTFLQEFESLIQSLASGDDVLAAWPDHCLLSGTRVTLQIGPNEVTGWCQGIDGDGALLLDTESGRQRFLGGTVKQWQ